MGPGFAGVGGFVDAVADGEIGADDAGAGADVDDVGVGGRYGDGADGAGGFAVEEGDPGGTVVGGAPDAAVIEADIEDVGLAGDAGEGAGAAGARWADGAPVHLRIEPRIERLRGEGRERKAKDG